MKQFSYAVIFAMIGGMVYILLNQEDKTTRNFEFIYSVELEASESPVKIWIPAPQNITRVQTITNRKIDYDKDLITCSEILTEEQHGNKYYYCQSNENKLKESTSLTLTCNVERKEHKKLKYKNIDSDFYKKGNIKVPAGAPFQEVIDSAKLTKKNIRTIYDHVLSGMHYGKPKTATDEDLYYNTSNKKTGEKWLPENKKYGRERVSKDEVVRRQGFAKGDAIYACDIGVGNCTDYHSYFMSLCRTMGVPARFHMGFLIPDEKEDSKGEVKGYHCWADYYKEGRGWFPVDISEADKDPSKIDYYFGTVDKNRIEFTIGRDLNLKNRDEPENFFIYPIVEGTEHTKSFKYKDL